jgi:hypothetical protein
MYLIGEFPEKNSAAAAIRSLRAGGLGTADFEVFSEEPVEFPRGVLDRSSRMSLVAVSGAILVGAMATGFIAWAQHDYRLITGGMPIFSFWATGVITFEMTMLGSVLATFGWFLWESGLLRKGDRAAPVAKVSPGSICLRVRCEGNQAARASEAMRRAGALRVSPGEPA